MAAAYVDAGAGSTGTTTTLNVAYPATVSANDILILFVVENTTSSGACDTPSGWTAHGSNPYATPGAGVTLYSFAKTASGSESGNLGLTGLPSGARQGARIYRFTGTGFSGASAAKSASASTTVNDLDITRTNTGDLAVNLVGINQNPTGVVSFTGETNGDWTEAVAEYVAGTNQTQQLQTSAFTGATVGGGSMTIGTAYNWGILGWLILDAGLTAITKDFIVKYNIDGQVAKDFIVKYDIATPTTAVSQSFIAKYDIYNQVAQGFIVKYDIANQVSKDFVVNYDIDGIVVVTVPFELRRRRGPRQPQHPREVGGI